LDFFENFSRRWVATRIHSSLVRRNKKGIKTGKRKRKILKSNYDFMLRGFVWESKDIRLQKNLTIGSILT